jgi:AraC-like DNA-binding protein
MVYEMYRPTGVLTKYVEFFWFFDDFFPGYTLERVLPQGSFELVIDLREIPRKLFTNSDQTDWRAYRRAWLSGPHSRFIVIDVLPASSMIGVHFRPGGASAFIPFPADELADRVEELDRIWGGTALELREQLLAAKNPAAKFLLLERFLLDQLQDDQCAAVDFAIGELIAQPATASISELASHTGLSHKHFISCFRQRVGLTPKRFCRIRRFQQALREIETRGALDWSGVAAETGYYDQTHFINDFRTFSGLNPSRYLMDRGEYLNFVPLDAR